MKKHSRKLRTKRY